MIKYNLTLMKPGLNDVLLTIICYGSLPLCCNSEFLFSINSHRFYNLLIYFKEDSSRISHPCKSHLLHVLGA